MPLKKKKISSYSKCVKSFYWRHASLCNLSVAKQEKILGFRRSCSQASFKKHAKRSVSRHNTSFTLSGEYDINRRSCSQVEITNG